MGRRLIITPNSFAKKVILSFCNENDIVMTVCDVKNKKYKGYDFDEISFHQYFLVKEMFGSDFDRCIDELIAYKNRKKQNK